MQYKNLFIPGLLFSLTLPLQILGYVGKIINYDISHLSTYGDVCGSKYSDDYFMNIRLNEYNIENDRRPVKTVFDDCNKCIKVVYNNKYAVGNLLLSSIGFPYQSIIVSPKIYKHFENKTVSEFQVDWNFVTCDLLGKMGKCSNSNCDESDQLKTNTTTTIKTITATNTTAPPQSNKITSTSSINIGGIILGCVIAILIGCLVTFMSIRKRHYRADFNSNEEFRNGSIKVVLKSNNNNDANVKIDNNNKDTKDEINKNSKESKTEINNNSKHSIVGINNNSKEFKTEINNNSKHSIVGINNNNKIVTTEIIKTNNDNKVVKNSKNAKTEINNNNNSNNCNNNNNNINNINQNNINQNNINQNNINQNNINQNNINQNMINSNNFNFNSLLGRNVFIYNFQNSGDFVMSSIPLFNNNSNNNNQNNIDIQRVPPSYEENEPLPEYSDVNKSMEKQQFM